MQKAQIKLFIYIYMYVCMYNITDSMHMSLSTLGDSKGQGSLVCCSSWGHKELDMS